jgi:hypothetical protein
MEVFVSTYKLATEAATPTFIANLPTKKVNKTFFPWVDQKFDCYIFWKPHFQNLYKGKYFPTVSIKEALISEGVLRFTTSTLIL